MSIKLEVTAQEQGAIPFQHNGNTHYLAETYVGLVLSVYENNGRDDSDFYAVVWNPEKEVVQSVLYASTRGGSYFNNATVDATEEVFVAARTYQAKKRAELNAEYEAKREAAQPVGKTAVITVKRGKRKELDGCCGKVFWIGNDAYNKGKRVGIEINNVKHFFPASNVRIAGQEFDIETAAMKYKCFQNVAGYVAHSAWNRF
jgi:hypothetical protein